MFSVEHPIFMAADDAQWIVDAAGHRTWPIRNYAIEGERRTNWFAPNVLKYHRRLATTLNALITAGFTLRRLEEFAPTAEQIADQPALREELDRPMMALISAAR